MECIALREKQNHLYNSFIIINTAKYRVYCFKGKADKSLFPMNHSYC